MGLGAGGEVGDEAVDHLSAADQTCSVGCSRVDVRRSRHWPCVQCTARKGRVLVQVVGGGAYSVVGRHLLRVDEVAESGRLRRRGAVERCSAFGPLHGWTSHGCGAERALVKSGRRRRPWQAVRELPREERGWRGDVDASRYLSRGLRVAAARKTHLSSCRRSAHATPSGPAARLGGSTPTGTVSSDSRAWRLGFGLLTLCRAQAAKGAGGAGGRQALQDERGVFSRADWRRATQHLNK